MKKAESKLLHGRDKLAKADLHTNTAEAGICVTDFYTKKILFANDKMAFYLGKPDAASVIGEVCQDHTGLKDGKRCPFCLRNKLIDEQGAPLKPQVKELYLEGTGLWMKNINQAIRRSDGRLLRMTTFYDITETKRMREQLSKCMCRDRLLGLKNDAVMERDIQATDIKPSLLLFDVQSMRKINEFYGREIGDYVLCAIRDWVLSCDILGAELYRIGGGRFCLAVKNVGGGKLKKVADSLFRLFAEPWVLEREGKRLWIFCNASVAVIPGGYLQENEPLSGMVERTLARAREKKKVVVYDRKMDRAYKDRLKLEWSLTRCIHDSMQGFEVYYQPIVDSAGDAWCGMEALCRWSSPELGAISPLVFIAEAERLELIGPLGLWVLETAVCKCKEWGLDCCDRFVLNVNLSALQFLDETLPEKIIEILDRYGFPGDKLCLEITESTEATFTDRSLQAIQRLRAHNLLVALDDFGTGYSSFSRLKSIPVDIVKIERIFVSDIEHNEYHRYLFRTMTELAHAADMALIAEGVERERQRHMLAEDGADYFQGYLFGRPLPQEQIEKELYRFDESMQTVDVDAIGAQGTVI